MSSPSVTRTSSPEVAPEDVFDLSLYVEEMAAIMETKPVIQTFLDDDSSNTTDNENPLLSPGLTHNEPNSLTESAAMSLVIDSAATPAATAFVNLVPEDFDLGSDATSETGTDESFRSVESYNLADILGIATELMAKSKVDIDEEAKTSNNKDELGLEELKTDISASSCATGTKTEAKPRKLMPRFGDPFKNVEVYEVGELIIRDLIAASKYDEELYTKIDADFCAVGEYDLDAIVNLLNKAKDSRPRRVKRKPDTMKYDDEFPSVEEYDLGAMIVASMDRDHEALNKTNVMTDLRGSSELAEEAAKPDKTEVIQSDKVSDFEPSSGVSNRPEQVARRPRGPGENDCKLPANPHGADGYTHTEESVNASGLTLDAWPKPLEREYSMSQKRAVNITGLPKDATVHSITSVLKNTGIVESIWLRLEQNKGIVNFVAPAAAQKVHDENQNGLQIKTPSGTHVVFVDLDPEVVVLSSTLREAVMITGATRVSRIVGADTEMLRRAVQEITGIKTEAGGPVPLLHYLAFHYTRADNRIDQVLARKNDHGYDECTIIFSGIRESMITVASLKKCIALEGCNITYGYDPCEPEDRGLSLIPGFNAPPVSKNTPSAINTSPSGRHSTSGKSYPPKTAAGDRYQGLAQLPSGRTLRK